jgi:hypothetical protein
MIIGQQARAIKCSRLGYRPCNLGMGNAADLVPFFTRTGGAGLSSS